jgi:hypothetical protein
MRRRRPDDAFEALMSVVVRVPCRFQVSAASRVSPSFRVWRSVAEVLSTACTHRSELSSACEGWVELSRSCCVLGCVVRGGSRCARRGRLPTTPQDVFHLRARSSSIHQINPFIPRPSAATAGVPGALGSLSRESAMLQVTVPDGVAEGGQFQANTPSGPRLVTVPPGVKSGQVIEISAPAPMVMEQTELAEASMAMVGTYHNDSSVCCGLGGGTTEVVVTESNQVLTQRIHGRMRFCGCNCGTIEGTGSRGVNDTTMVFTTTSINRGVPTPATNTQTITSATRDKIEMDWDMQTNAMPPRMDMHLYGKMTWDLAAGTIKHTTANHPLAPTTIYVKA